MSDFEDRIARAFAADSQPSDEAFVLEVSRRVALDERIRKVRLTIATLAAVCLGAALCYGASIAWTVESMLLSSGPEAASVATPLFASVTGVLMFVLLLPLTRARP